MQDFGAPFRINNLFDLHKNFGNIVFRNFVYAAQNHNVQNIFTLWMIL